MPIHNKLTLPQKRLFFDKTSLGMHPRVKALRREYCEQIAAKDYVGAEAKLAGVYAVEIDLLRQGFKIGLTV